MSFGAWVEGLRRWVRDVVEAPPAPPAPRDVVVKGEPVDWFTPAPAGDRALGLVDLLEGAGPGAGAGAAAAAWEIRATLATLPRRELARVDEEVRRALRHWPRDRLDWLTRPAWVRWEYPTAAAPWVLGLISFHPSGFTREVAVRRLAELTGGDELPFLLLRANDWVEPVRRHAAGAVRARLVPENAALLVRELPLVLRLRESGRGGHAPLVEAVLALLGTPDARPALLAGLDSGDAPVRRACFQVLAGAGEGLREVVQLGLRSADPVVRRRAACEAPRLDDAALAELVPAMMRDGSAAVRLEAALLARRIGADGERWLREAAFDRNATVRAAGRAALSPGSPKDFAGEYRAVLESVGGPRVGALLGLGETGGGLRDAVLVAGFRGDWITRVREAAVEALARLERADLVSLLAPLLGDPSRRVSRAARVALERHAAAVDEGLLAELFAADRPAHVRCSALALLARRTKWEALPWILRALADADPAVAADARAWLSRWRTRFNRSFVAPAPDQLARAAAALRDAGGSVDGETRDWLRTVLPGDTA